MNNLEELKKKYEELGEEIKRLENKEKIKRWRALKKRCYYTVHGTEEPMYVFEKNTSFDDFNYKTRNYFAFKWNAIDYRDNLITYYELMDLADELNKNKKINWYSLDQSKYYIYYDFYNKKLNCSSYLYYKDLRQIYCLDKNFLTVALQRIGKERLEKLFKGE